MIQYFQTFYKPDSYSSYKVICNSNQSKTKKAGIKCQTIIQTQNLIHKCVCHTLTHTPRAHTHTPTSAHHVTKVKLKLSEVKEQAGVWKVSKSIYTSCASTWIQLK